jgi:hypothetical protein
MTIEDTANAIFALSKHGHTSVECMNRLPEETYHLSADDLATAFRLAGEMLEREATEIERFVQTRQKGNAA